MQKTFLRWGLWHSAWQLARYKMGSEKAEQTWTMAGQLSNQSCVSVGWCGGNDNRGTEAGVTSEGDQRPWPKGQTSLGVFGLAAGLGSVLQGLAATRAC